MEILKEQQKCVKGIALKFYFLLKKKKEFRLEYISVQGRALLIYCCLMTMIIVFKVVFFFTFLLEKGCFLLHLCLFMMFL